MQTPDYTTKAMIINKIIDRDYHIKDIVYEHLLPIFLANQKKQNMDFDSNLKRGMEFAIYTVLRGLSTRTIHNTLVKVCIFVVYL